MKHVSSVTKTTPALAVASGLLTKSVSGTAGMNEIGDVPIVLGGLVDNAIPVASAWWQFIPAGVGSRATCSRRPKECRCGRVRT